VAVAAVAAVAVLNLATIGWTWRLSRPTNSGEHR